MITISGQWDANKRAFSENWGLLDYKLKDWCWSQFKKKNNNKIAIINIWNYITEFIIKDVNFVIFTNTGLKIN